jgi:hypothetical protein
VRRAFGDLAALAGLLDQQVDARGTTRMVIEPPAHRRHAVARPSTSHSPTACEKQACCNASMRAGMSSAASLIETVCS